MLAPIRLGSMLLLIRNLRAIAECFRREGFRAVHQLGKHLRRLGAATRRLALWLSLALLAAGIAGAILEVSRTPSHHAAPRSFPSVPFDGYRGER